MHGVLVALIFVSGRVVVVSALAVVVLVWVGFGGGVLCPYWGFGVFLDCC